MKSAENLVPAGIRSTGPPATGKSLCRLSYPAHVNVTHKTILSCAMTAGGNGYIFGHVHQTSLTCLAKWKRYCLVNYCRNFRFYCGAQKDFHYPALIYKLWPSGV